MDESCGRRVFGWRPPNDILDFFSFFLLDTLARQDVYIGQHVVLKISSKCGREVKGSVERSTSAHPTPSSRTSPSARAPDSSTLAQQLPAQMGRKCVDQHSCCFA